MKVKTNTILNSVVSVVIIFIIILFFGITYYNSLSKVSFHSDEMLWPCMGGIYEYYIHGNWTSDYWTRTPYDFTNGPVSRYIYGWWDSKNSRYNDIRINCANLWPNYVGKQFKDLNSLEKDFIFYNRSLNTFLSIIFLIISYIYIKKLFGMLPAVISIFLIGLNPLYRLYANRSMAEISLLLFMTISLYTLSELLNRLLLNKTGIVIPIIYGLLCGLSTMTKPYGIMVFVPWIILLFILPINLRVKIITSLYILLALFLTILLLYPPFLLNPASFIDWIRTWLDIQKEFQIQFPKDILMTPIDKIITIFKYVLIYNNNNQINIFPILNIIFMNYGIYSFIKTALYKKTDLKEYFTFSVTTGFILCGIFYLYRNWDRYFLPYLIILSLIYAYSIESIIKLFSIYFIKYICKKKQNRF